MKCPSCGAYNPEGAAFCDLCSHNFGQAPSDAPEVAARPISSHEAKPPPPPVKTKRSRSHRSIYIGLAIALVLVVAGILGYTFLSGGQSQSANPKPRPNANPRTLSVLFIGNSYTFVNDLPATVSKLSQSLGNTLDYGMAATGGYTLQQNASNPDTIAKIKSKKWDCVVLQEQSQLPAIFSDAEKAQFITPYA